MDGIKKAFLPHSGSSKNSSRKPRLDRKNAIKNPNFVAPDTGEDDDPFRLDGGDNSEESVETLLKILDIETTDMLGIPTAMWDARPESRAASGRLVFHTQPEEAPPVISPEALESNSISIEPARVAPAGPPPRRNSLTFHSSSRPDSSPPENYSANTSRAITARLETATSAPATVLSHIPLETAKFVKISSMSSEGGSTASSQSMGSYRSVASVSGDEDEEFMSTVNWDTWTKVEKLGSGSFGVVYKGVNCRGEFFAVKEISIPNSEQVNEQMVQLQQEIKFLQECQHENIVHYLGTERTKTELYIFLELAAEGSLATLYRKVTLYDPIIRSYTKQILQGLKYLHDRNCVHRDLKCANILVQPNGRIKLADFGMARQLERIDSMRSCKGTAYWMAPEVMDPKKRAGLPSDIWSLGCTVLEMATGEPPFSGMPWMAVFWKVGKDGELPSIPSDLPEDTKDFISQCLRLDPASRPTVAMLLKHPLVNSEAPATVNLKTVTSRAYSLERAPVMLANGLSAPQRTDSLERSQVRSVRTRPSILARPEMGR